MFSRCPLFASSSPNISTKTTKDLKHHKIERGHVPRNSPHPLSSIPRLMQLPSCKANTNRNPWIQQNRIMPLHATNRRIFEVGSKHPINGLKVSSCVFQSHKMHVTRPHIQIASKSARPRVSSEVSFNAVFSFPDRAAVEPVRITLAGSAQGISRPKKLFTKHT